MKVKVFACLLAMRTALAARFTMIDADTAKDVRVLCTSSRKRIQLNFGAIPKSVAFRVDRVTAPVRVRITGDSSLAYNRVEKNAPYSFYGDSGSRKYNGRSGFVPGTYVLTANGESCTLEIFAGVKELRWIDGQRRTFKLNNGAKLLWDDLPKTINVEAVTVGPVASVKLERLRKNGSYKSMTQRSRPFAFFGRDGNRFSENDLSTYYDPFGAYGFRTTAYDSRGRVLNSLTTSFTIEARGTWNRISQAGNRRHEGGFVQCGGDKLWQIGGRSTRDTDIYDVSSRTFTRGPRIRNIHHFQPVCVSGIIYIVCGMTGNFPSEPPLPNVYYIDAQKSNPTLVKGRSIPAARRRGGAAATVYKGCIYVVGGITLGHTSGTKNWFDRYCPGSNTWTSNLPQPKFRRDHVQATILRDTLYVVGGRQSDYTTDSGYDDEVGPIEWYNFQTKKWAQGPPLPKPRAAASVVTYFNMIVVIGGESSLQADAHNEVSAFDPRTRKWHNLRPIVSERHATSATVFQNKIWIMGGSGNRGGNPELTNLETFTL